MEPSRARLGALQAQLETLRARQPANSLLEALQMQLNALEMQADALQMQAGELQFAYVGQAAYALQVQMAAVQMQLSAVQEQMTPDAKDKERPSAEKKLQDFPTGDAERWPGPEPEPVLSHVQTFMRAFPQSAICRPSADTSAEEIGVQSATQSPRSVDAAKSPTEKPRLAQEYTPLQKLPPPLYSVAIHRLFRDKEGSRNAVEIRGKQTFMGVFFRADDVARAFCFRPRQLSQANGFYPGRHFAFFAKNPDKFLTAQGLLHACTLIGHKTIGGLDGSRAPVFDKSRFQGELAALLCGRQHHRFNER